MDGVGTHVSPVAQEIPSSRPSLLKDIIMAVALNIFVFLIVIPLEYQFPFLTLGIRVGTGLLSLIVLFTRHLASRYQPEGATIVTVVTQPQNPPSFFSRFWREWPQGSSYNYNSGFSGVAGQPMYTPPTRGEAPAFPEYSAVGSAVAGQPMYTPPTRGGAPASPQYSAVGSAVAGQPMFTPPSRI